MLKEDALGNIKGIGSKTIELFKKLKIDNVGELLEYYPTSYDYYGEPVDIECIRIGYINTIRATVSNRSSLSSTYKRGGRLVSIEALIGDITIIINYYNMPYMRKALKAGDTYIFRGKLVNKNGIYSMEHPTTFKTEEYQSLIGTLQPRYGLTKGLTNNKIRKGVAYAIDNIVSTEYEEIWPCDIIQNKFLIDAYTATKMMHFPNDMNDLTHARHRLAFDELLIYILGMRILDIDRIKVRIKEPMIRVADTCRLIDRLPYRLTKDQINAWSEIEEDMSSDCGMNRLLQGDVGSGKTIIAILALLMTAANNKQGCMMAPTEVLAIQHYEAIVEMSMRLGLCIKPILLVGSMSAKEKSTARKLIASMDVNVIIGTHALIVESVEYSKLALAITDEQHRFGVSQRSALAGKGDVLHILAMSATPIPRTLSLMIYSNMKISVIKNIPQGRLPIKNCVVGKEYRYKAYRFIEEECLKGRQAYVVCPQIEDGEWEGACNVIEYCAILRDELDSCIRVEYIHGKMLPRDKNRIMNEFDKGNIDVLVSTTVIEVGVNVPNATVIMIENAERFGLAGLHQLRGRVGRGQHQSYAIFINTCDDEAATRRLDVLNNTNDGFKIAELDLEMRGPGDIFGVRQSGDLRFKVANIYADVEIVKDACNAAEVLLDSINILGSDEYAKIIEFVNARLGRYVDNIII